MTIQLRLSDRFGATLPAAALVEHPEIRDAIESYEAARAKRWKAWQATTDAPAREAVQADAQALADALAAGEPDPGPVHVVEHDAAVADGRRRAESADVLLDRAVAEVQQALTEHGDEWVAQLERDHVEAVRAFQGVVDLLGEAQSRLVSIDVLRRFTRTGRYWPEVPTGGVEDAISVLRASTPAVEPVEEPTAA